MKLTEIFNQGKSTLSFEFFPPKTADQEKHLFEVIEQLKTYKPDFVSVTYGAMGKTSGKTFFWSKEIKEKHKIEPVVHLTCVAASRKDILSQLNELEKNNMKNILALRGDPPEGMQQFSAPKDGFRFAKELIAYIKENKPDFCLGAAGYPEKHPLADNIMVDVDHLKQKVEAGAEFIITQLFFDNNHFYSFKEKCNKKGIKVPIIPGIMPIVSYKSIKRMTGICGAQIPAKLHAKLEKHKGDKQSILQIGEEQAIEQCRELQKANVPGLHFFVMNQAEPISAILDELKR